MLTKLTALRDRLAKQWRTSLQVRVVGSILLLSLVVVALLAFGMTTVVADRLLSAKVSAASNEITQAAATVETQISATDASSSIQTRLNSARASVNSARSSGANGGDLTAAEKSSVYDVVLLAPNPDGSMVSAPEANGPTISDSLQAMVRDGQGNVAYEFDTFRKSDGSSYKALVIGTPTDTDIRGVELYLIMPLTAEESTLALMRGIAAFGGVVLVVLLVGIMWLLTQQVTMPVRSASRIAERFASGHLRERMVVDGEDEMARLAISFNSMAESFSKQIHQLQEYGSLQRQFTSDVSHELRTPLTTVRMAADMIYDHSDSLDTYTKRAAELMVRELDRFEALLNDLLEISRHDAGVAELSEERIDVRSIIKSAWSQVEHLSEEVGAPVTFDVPDEPVFAHVDARRIERILRNILANAFDHSESNPINVKLVESSDHFSISVTDHGVGLKPGQEELVFNRFWRADPSRKRHSGGTGLGLAISREDALLHGGSITAEGEWGVGSTFTVTIPKHPPKREEPESDLVLRGVLHEEEDFAVVENDSADDNEVAGEGHQALPATEPGVAADASDEPEPSSASSTDSDGALPPGPLVTPSMLHAHEVRLQQEAAGGGEGDGPGGMEENHEGEPAGQSDETRSEENR